MSKSEFNQLEAFINSPFFLKRNDHPLKLYLAIKKYAPKFEIDKMTKEAIFEVVYPKVKYNDGKMRNLLSRTVKIVDSYLLYLADEADEFLRDKRLSEVYNKRNIESEFFNYSRRLLADLNKVTQKDVDYYFNKFSLEKEMYFHRQNDRKNSIPILVNSIQSFHNYIALEEVNIKLEVYNLQKIYVSHVEISPLSYSKDFTSNNISLHLINSVNDLFITNRVNLIEIIDEFEKKISFLSQKDSKNIFVALQNYAAQNSTKNPKIYAPIQFQLHQLGLKHKLLFINNEIFSASYINIVVTGIRLKKYNWTLQFIEEYEKKLKKSEAIYTKKLALIFLNFGRENYQETIMLTNKVRFPDIRRELNSKTIRIRCYFKLFQNDFSYHNLIIKQFNAFDKFLKRENSLIASRKLGNENFIKFLRRITNAIIKDNWTISFRMNIKKEIETIKNITYRDWLLEIVK